MSWLFDERNEPPKELREAIERACREPGALGPATKASVSAVILMLTRLAVVAEKRVMEMHTKHEQTLSKHEARLEEVTKTSENSARLLAAFHPRSYENREPGTKQVRMGFDDGSIATITTSFEKPGRQPMAEQASRVERLEERVELLVSTVKSLVDAASAHVSLGLADRGVFHSGNSYLKGEWCTHEGSLWIAQADTADKPGSSAAWRLAVKRGRDGRDAAQ